MALRLARICITEPALKREIAAVRHPYLFAFLISAALSGTPAAADPVADFYRGKTISMVIGLSSGGDYDLRARLLARHMGKHIPGNPLIVPRNMTGAGGVTAANWLTKVAPRDGTAILMVTQNMPFAQALGSTGVDFDTRRFNWIGNTTDTPNVLTVWHTAGVRTVAEATKKELAIGATGAGTGTYYYPAALNAVAGTKFKIVTGYPGGNELNLAMERGEIDGRGSNSWAAWKSTKPQWIAEKKIVHLAQIGLKRHPELTDVPLLSELAKTDIDRAVMVFISAETDIARAIATTPDTPPERVAALRKAFDATMKDPEFLAEAEKSGFDISPVSGVEAQKIATSIVDTPPEVVARAKAILEGPAK
jgi:tripartite-type tricarboxylate transporter receptor subunit TctC